MAWLTGYSHRKKITVQTANLDGSLSGFPLLVKFTADADIGAVCLASGYDVRFAASDGETELPFERESFAVAAGEATGVFFVLSDIAPSPATEIYVYYGNASATDASDPATVWAGYISRWALNESSGAAIDSCGANEGTYSGTSFPAQVAGPYNKAQNFNGTDNKVSIGTSATLDPTEITVSLWVQRKSSWNSGNKVFVSTKHTWDNDHGWLLSTLAGDTVPIAFFVTNPNKFVVDGIPDNFYPVDTWVHIAATFKSSDNARAIYKNGVAQSLTDGGTPDVIVSDAITAKQIGKMGGEWDYAKDYMAEVRIASVAKSAEWIKFEYHNIAEADNELTWGTEEDAEVIPPEPEPPAPAPVYAYADFEAINAGTVFSKGWRDQRFVLGLRDLRDGINIKLPEDTYRIEDFPAMDDSLAGKVRPFAYGTITNQVANRIDATYGRFEFHNGRCKSVAHVYKNAVELAIDTDCFIDYQRGRVILSAGALAAWTDSDIMTVDFTGWCNTADEAYTTAADIFIDLHIRYAGLVIAELADDAIYKAKLDATEALAFVVDAQDDLQEITRRVERSIGASSYQDGSGRLGLRVSPSTAPGNVVYIKNAHVFDMGSDISLDAVYSAVVVKYNRNPQDDTWSTVTKAITRAEWDYRKRPALEVETYLTSAADALALALEIAARLEKPSVSFEVPGVLFGSYPGDVVYLTRDRYPSLSGVAANVLMRIMKITKSLSENKTIIEAEEV
jgi:hypothetical protein